MGHLRVFGSIAYAHVPDQHRKKLEDKSRKLVFVGYDDKSKAYRLYNPKDKRIEISRDVQFDENSSWDWNEGKETQRAEPEVVLTPVIGDLRGKSIAVEDENTSSDDESRDSEPRGQRTIEQGESSNSANSEEPRQPRYRSLEDIYNQGEVHLVCLLADSEDITYSEAVKDKK